MVLYDNKTCVNVQLLNDNYSKFETWSYIEGECKITGTIYHSNLISNYYFMKTEDIINKWIKELEI